MHICNRNYGLLENRLYPKAKSLDAFFLLCLGLKMLSLAGLDGQDFSFE